MTPITKIKEIFEVNFFSQLRLTQKLMKIMIKNKKGSIINISSNAAQECDAGRSGYASSKAALIAFTKVLSKELGSFNIRVNAVAPGLTDTYPSSQSVGLSAFPNVFVPSHTKALEIYFSLQSGSQVQRQQAATS